MEMIMGEYFKWVNVDKKEYISPSDFDYGSKRIESLFRGNDFLRALFDLLSNEWAGNRILWLGDDKLILKDTENDTLRILYEDSLKLGYEYGSIDTVHESYKNVSSLFKTAEAIVREEIGIYLEDIKNNDDYAVNEYGIDVDNPFEGLFLRDGKDFCCTINHTKKVCYSFDRTKILYKDKTESDDVDPLPLLMSCGRTTNDGEWLGDIIGVADEIPKGYRLLSEIYLDWQLNFQFIKLF